MASTDNPSDSTWAGKPHKVWVDKLLQALSDPNVKELLRDRFGKKRVNEITARGVLRAKLQEVCTAREISDLLKQRAAAAKADRKRKRESLKATALAARKRQAAAGWDGVWPDDAVSLGYAVERSKSGRSKCVKCREAILNQTLRIKLYLKTHTHEVRFCECDACEKGRAEMGRLNVAGFYHVACCADPTAGFCVDMH